MHAHVIHARLVIRLAGLALAGMCVPRLAIAITVTIRNWLQPRTGFGMDETTADLLFYWFRIDTQALFRWLYMSGVPVSMFMIGALLLLRGSRSLERKVSHVLQNA